MSHKSMAAMSAKRAAALTKMQTNAEVKVCLDAMDVIMRLPEDRWHIAATLIAVWLKAKKPRSQP